MTDHHEPHGMVGIRHRAVIGTYSGLVVKTAADRGKIE
jgi:hypothetical protein